jgi:hypothetical protein
MEKLKARKMFKKRRVSQLHTVLGGFLPMNDFTLETDNTITNIIWLATLLLKVE